MESFECKVKRSLGRIKAAGRNPSIEAIVLDMRANFEPSNFYPVKRALVNLVDGGEIEPLPVRKNARKADSGGEPEPRIKRSKYHYSTVRSAEAVVLEIARKLIDENIPPILVEITSRLPASPYISDQLATVARRELIKRGELPDVNPGDYSQRRQSLNDPMFRPPAPPGSEAKSPPSRSRPKRHLGPFADDIERLKLIRRRTGRARRHGHVPR